MKASSKFLIKGIYLILVIIAIAIVTNQIMSVNLTAKEELEKITFRKEASDILEILLSSEKCLATKKLGLTEKIINISALDDFQAKYSDIEPDCARNYEYGYSVKIEKFNFTKISGSYDPKISVGNRDIVLILDNSASMKKLFNLAVIPAAEQFVACADNETDRISLVVFKAENDNQYCGVDTRLGLTSLTTEYDTVMDKIENGIDVNFGTPLIGSLIEAERILSAPGTQDNKMIILFTDGLESCCDACKDIAGLELGTKDCLTPCQKSLCKFANSTLSKQGVPIYSIYLGEDPTGIEQTNCTSEKTGGKFYNISEPDIEILGKLFCRIVAKERETSEDYQEWFFGSKNHSADKALKNYVTVSMPISIKITDTKTQPGIATIRLYKGELEELVGLIDQTCATGLETKKQIYMSYSVYEKVIEGKNYLCMKNAGKTSCRRLACENVKFEGINAPGMYDFYFKKEDNTVKVIV